MAIKHFSAEDIENMRHYEKLSRLAFEFFAGFLDCPVPRTVPSGWLDAMQSTIFRKGRWIIRLSLLGLLVVAVYPPWGKYYGVCLMGILFGMVLVLSGKILKRIHQNVLSYGSLSTGELADMSVFGGFYILTIRLQTESAAAMTRKVAVPKRIAIFFGIEKLALGTDVKLLYSPGCFKPVLLLPVVFYRIQMGQREPE